MLPNPKVINTLTIVLDVSSSLFILSAELLFVKKEKCNIFTVLSHKTTMICQIKETY